MDQQTKFSMPSLQSHSAGFEQNSSNKELSPDKSQKETAFMRAMLRDDTPRREQPHYPHRQSNNTLGEDFRPSQTDSFLEQFSQQLKELTN